MIRPTKRNAKWSLRKTVVYFTQHSPLKVITCSRFCVTLVGSAFTLHANSSCAVEFATALAEAISFSSLAFPWTAAFAASQREPVAAATILACRWREITTSNKANEKKKGQYRVFENDVRSSMTISQFRRETESSFYERDLLWTRKSIQSEEL